MDSLSENKREKRRHDFDGCFKFIQCIFSTYPRKKEDKKNKTFSFSYFALMMEPAHAGSEKEKIFGNELDFLVFFAILELGRLNNAKF